MVKKSSDSDNVVQNVFIFLYKNVILWKITFGVATVSVNNLQTGLCPT